MAAIKTPAVITRDRKNYEDMLMRLDDYEQAWSELSRGEQAAELFHEGSCGLNHYTECDFTKTDWTAPNEIKGRYYRAVVTAFELAPNLEPEVVAKILIEGRKVS